MIQRIDFVQRTMSPVFPQYRWWHKPRWWLVKLLGGQDPNETVTLVRIPVDGKIFAERLFKQKRYLFDQFGRQAQTLLMGAQDYEELMGCKGIDEAFTMQSQFNHGRHEVYGLTVNVIPWMRGILVMP